MVLESWEYVKQINNPWNVHSIFDFCYFCCPDCDWKVTNTQTGKQEFVNHASIYHTSVIISRYIIIIKGLGGFVLKNK
jgi:hydrogenase maturation factor HypF (carbamoyltransferase family)